MGRKYLARGLRIREGGRSGTDPQLICNRDLKKQMKISGGVLVNF